MKRIWIGLGFILVLSGIGLWVTRYSAVPAAADPPFGFTNQQFITDLAQPVSIDFAPDGRMFTLELIGLVRVVQPGNIAPDPLPVLVMPNVAIGLEDTGQGALTLRLDPDFTNNGYMYIFYTARDPARDRVSRFQVNGNFALPGSEVVIYEDNVDRGEWHLGGGLDFGPDGKLYLGIGDHHDESPGSDHVAQRLDSLRGKILRLNPDGSIPTDNPFYDGAGPNADAIWARGLRNPFRLAFNPLNGELLIAEVGGNINLLSVEEVNLGAAGANYGWPMCEGSCIWSDMTSPWYSYSHDGRDASITGGVVYTGSQFPEEMVGAYFYADYAQNWIRYLTDEGESRVSHPFEPEDGSHDGEYGDIVDLDVGPDGALYYVDIGRSWDGIIRPGSIHKITYNVDNLAPAIVQATADPTSRPFAPLTVTFTGEASDPEGAELTYIWDLGNGLTQQGATVTHTYWLKGHYTARLYVSDGVNQVFSDLIDIVVGQPPVASIDAPADGLTFRAGDIISYSGSAVDPDGELTADNFSWTIVFHHEDHVHPVAGPITGTTAGELVIPTAGHDFSGLTFYEVLLTVTDANGIQDVTSVYLYPEEVNLTLDSSPPGINLSLDFITLPAPFTWDSLINFEHTLNAPWVQTHEGADYAFESWSDGGDAHHAIVVPETNATYTANYCQSLLYDGSFEAGVDSTYWGQQSWNTPELICPEWDCGNLPNAHTGDYLAWLGQINSNVTYVYQVLTVPDPAPTLRFWTWVDAPASCGFDVLKVLFLNGPRLIELYSEPLCGQDDEEWALVEVDLSEVAGRFGSLAIWAKNDLILPSQVFVDDVSLCLP